MIIFLILLVVIILILLNKKVKFNIDASVIGVEYNFCININYFVDIVTLYKEDIIKYNNKKIKMKDSKWILKYINVDRINLDIKIGLDDVFITSMAIPILSTILAILLQKYFANTTKNFRIKPIYNKLFFSLKGATYISIKLKDLVYIFYKIKVQEKQSLNESKKNGKMSKVKESKKEEKVSKSEENKKKKYMPKSKERQKIIR